jgi:protocatechuate 3,4-dioxygenase beta subunit
VRARTRTLIAAGAALVGALALWRVLGTEAPDGTSAIPARAESFLAGEEGTPEVAPAPEPARVEVAKAPPADGALASEPATNVLQVLVRAVEDHRPVERARVIAGPVGAKSSWRNVDGRRGERGEAPLTGPDGVAELVAAPGERWQLRVQGPHGQHEQLEIDVPHEEEARIVVELPTAADLRIRGRLVDAETEAPLRGEVKARPRGHSSVGPAIPTDAGGYFEMTYGSWSDPYVGATAEGYAEAFFRASAAATRVDEAYVVRLERAATLEVAVTGSTGAALEGARVRLETKSYDLVQDSLHSMSSGSFSTWSVAWKGKSGPDGLATLAGLPPRVPLELTVTGEGAHRVDAQPVVLEPGERRRLEVQLGAGVTIEGLLLDASGAPIPGQTIARVAGDRPGMLARHDEPVERTPTDRNGRFRFTHVPVGAWRVGPAVGSRDVPPLAKVVHVETTSGTVEVVIEVERGLTIAGTLLDPAGEPVANGHVSLSQPETRSGTYGSTDSEGRFELGPLLGGTWSATARQHGSKHAPSEPTSLTAGTKGAVLWLRQGGWIAGEVVDGGTGERVLCTLGCTRSGELGYSQTGSRDGEVNLQGLLPGTYTLTAETADGRVGVVGGLRVEAGLAADVRIEVSPGATLELVYEGGADSARASLHRGESTARWTSFERGKLERLTVVPGAIEIRWGEAGELDLRRRAAVTLEAGETRRVVLRAAD